MISIKYLYVIIPVLILLIGIIWSIIHMSMSKKKVIKNTNPVFISTKGATKKEHKREIKLEDKHAKRIAGKTAKESKKKAKADKKKAYREAKKKAKTDKKKSKKSKRKHRKE